MGSRAQVVQQAYEAFARGDIPGVVALLDDGVEWSVPATLPHGGTFAGLGAAWERLDLDVEAVDETGDGLVVGVLRADGTRRGGGPSGCGAVHVFDVRNGRIARFREYTDVGGALA